MLNESKKEIILHVGLHKTGTTSIQDTLFENKNNEMLRNMGYYYPNHAASNHRFLHHAFCDNPQKGHVAVISGLGQQQAEKEFKKTEKEILNGHYSKFVFSSENLSILSAENLENLKQCFVSLFSGEIDFKIIIYVRNPLKWAISDIQQRIKVGDSYEPSIHKTTKSLNDVFIGRAKKFFEVFGRENVKVYSFEEGLKHECGIVGHFINEIGVSEALKSIEIDNSNRSASLLSCYLMSYINEEVPLYDNGSISHNRFRGDLYPIEKIKGQKFDLPKNIKETIANESREAIHWLSEHAGIDYAENMQIGDNRHPEIVFDEGTIAELKQAFFESSLVVKESILDFLREQKGNDNLDAFISELESSYHLIRQSTESLGLRKNMDTAELYRDMAVFMEGHGRIKSAHYFMALAAQIRPDGPFIQEKCKQYEELLN